VTELHDEFAVVRVNRLADSAPERDAIVSVNRGVVRDDAAAGMNRDERRDDRADAALGELHFPIDAGLRSGTVVVVEPAGNVGPEDPVLDRQVLEAQRLKDDVRHDDPPAAAMRRGRRKILWRGESLGCGPFKHERSA
jgi:hypothetical protein